MLKLSFYTVVCSCASTAPRIFNFAKPKKTLYNIKKKMVMKHLNFEYPLKYHLNVFQKSINMEVYRKSLMETLITADR